MKAKTGSTPPVALLRVAMWNVLLIGLAAGVACALIDGWRSPGRIMFFGIAAVVTAIAATVVSADNIRRTGVLRRARERFQRENVPPSPSALRDAVRAPWRVAGAVFVAGFLVTAVELASDGAVSGSTSGAIWAAGYAWIGICLLLWSPIALFTRDVMRSWLRPYDPRGLVQLTKEGFLSRLGADMLLTTVGASVVAESVFLARSVDERTTPLWFVVVIVGCVGTLALVCAVLVFRALRVERSIRALGGHVREHRPGMLFSPPSGAVPQLAESLKRLVERYADTVRRETSTRDLMDRSQREKTMLMARLTHDLRSPLNSILGFAELLLMNQEGDLNPQQKESVVRIVTSGQELLVLLNDVLDAAKFEAGKLPLHRQWTPSVEILTEAVAEGESLLVDKPRVRITTELQPGLPAVHVDSMRIVQAIVGLLRHCVRVMDDGSVNLWARMGVLATGDPAVLVDVSDTSSGIREEDRERIFEAFWDVSQVSGRRIGGLGVGLALARNLVCAHGGDVRCESAQGRGTTFTVTIPVGQRDKVALP